MARCPTRWDLTSPGRRLRRPSSSHRTGEHRAVADVEGRAACRERSDVINDEVGSGVGVALVSRTPVPLLTTPCPKHSRAEARPGSRAVQRVVAAAFRLPAVVGIATTRAARHDPADGAQPHRSHRMWAGTLLTLVTLECGPVDITKSVGESTVRVYSPPVLLLQGQLLDKGVGGPTPSWSRSGR